MAESYLNMHLNGHKTEGEHEAGSEISKWVVREIFAFALKFSRSIQNFHGAKTLPVQIRHTHLVLSPEIYHKPFS